MVKKQKQKTTPASNESAPFLVFYPTRLGLQCWATAVDAGTALPGSLVDRWESHLMLRTLFETPVPVATVSGSVRLKMAFTAPRISNFWSISELSIRSRERVICGGRKFAGGKKKMTSSLPPHPHSSSLPPPLSPELTGNRARELACRVQRADLQMVVCAVCAIWPTPCERELHVAHTP